MPIQTIVFSIIVHDVFLSPWMWSATVDRKKSSYLHPDVIFPGRLSVVTVVKNVDRTIAIANKAM